MRKHSFMVILLFLLVLVPSMSIATSEGVSAPPSPLFSGGSGAGEWDNIDTFEVHPASGRWDVTAGGFTVPIVQDGILNFTDVGDGSADYYKITRDLASMDSKVEWRFMIQCNDSTNQYYDEIYFILSDAAFSSTNYIVLDLLYIKDGANCDSRIKYKDVDNTEHSISLSADEDIPLDEWITLRMDYDIFRSSFRLRGYTDDDTKFFDYTADEIFGTYFPKLFSQTTLGFGIFTQVYSNGKEVNFQLDYVEAKFKEREWKQTTEPTDTDWLTDNVFSCYVQDDINDESEYQLVVPYLDAISGNMECNFTNPSNLGDGDSASIVFYLYAIDADDGDHHVLFLLGVILANQAPFGNLMGIQIDAGGSNVVYITEVGTFNPGISFSINTYNDRSEASIHARVYYDVYTDTYYDYAANVTIADEADDPSQEFLLDIDYTADFDGNSEFTGIINSFDFIRKESLTDLSPRNDPGFGTKGYSSNKGGANDPLSILFQTLAETIIAGLYPIAKAITDVLSPFLDGLEGLLTTVGTWLSDIYTALGTLADGIATAIWSAAEAGLSFLTGTITDIFDYIGYVWGVLETLVDDFLGALVDIAGDLIDAGLTFLGTAISTLLEIGWGIWYGIWEAVGLEGIFTIGDQLFTGLLQTITGIPTLLTDMINAIQTLWYLIPAVGFLVFFGIPLCQKNIGGYIEMSIDLMTFDILLGFKPAGFIPAIPAVFVWLVVSIALVLTGTTYVGFF